MNHRNLNIKTIAFSSHIGKMTTKLPEKEEA
jgi:hypothetical protein